MCNRACIEFAMEHLIPEMVSGKTAIEVGSLDHNGSLRQHVQSLRPARFLGVDIQMGPGVDELCAADQLLTRYGTGSFDLVISTEMLEHVRDWRSVVHNLKSIVRPGGVLLVTTRSFGFPFHGFPFDFWRYEVADFRVIFSDFQDGYVAPDPSDPGVFFVGRKPHIFTECDLAQYSLYSIITNRCMPAVSDIDLLTFRAGYYLTKAKKEGIGGVASRILRLAKRFLSRN